MRRRLTISRETLTQLSGDELAGIVGGAIAWTEPCVQDLKDYINKDILDFSGQGESTVICI